jgi:hypothetical protein
MHNKSYRVPIDGEWDLVDLNEFPRIYRQLYSVIYSFEGEFSPSRNERIDEIFTRHPWKGGFSTINWFSDLYSVIPAKDRPKVLSMQYASPGWIDLGLYVGTAISLRSMLVAISSAVRHVNETYNLIQNGIHERELNKIELKQAKLKLERENHDFVIESCEKMAELMGFKHLKQMHKRTGNPFVSLKMLLAIYRRLRDLQKFEIEGKTRIGAD